MCGKMRPSATERISHVCCATRRHTHHDKKTIDYCTSGPISERRCFRGATTHAFTACQSRKRHHASRDNTESPQNRVHRPNNEPQANATSTVSCKASMLRLVPPLQLGSGVPGGRQPCFEPELVSITVIPNKSASTGKSMPNRALNPCIHMPTEVSLMGPTHQRHL